MSFTVEEAVDTIFGHFKEQWEQQSNAPVILYDDFGQELPGTDTPWVRIQLRHNTGGQETLGPPEQQKFEREGVITVQVFTPLGDGRLKSDRLSQNALRAFEGKVAKKGTDEVWFRRVRMTEVGRSDAWYQVNVTAEFEYDFRKPYD